MTGRLREGRRCAGGEAVPPRRSPGRIRQPVGAGAPRTAPLPEPPFEVTYHVHNGPVAAIDAVYVNHHLLPPDQYELLTEEHPRNRLEQLKARWLPSRLKRWWPVKMESRLTGAVRLKLTPEMGRWIHVAIVGTPKEET